MPKRIDGTMLEFIVLTRSLFGSERLRLRLTTLERDPCDCGSEPKRPLSLKVGSDIADLDGV